MDTEEILRQIGGLNQVEALEYFAKKFQGQVVFSTSFGMEDQVITHLIAKNKIPVEIFTLDTGRMFSQTYNTWENTEAEYKIRVKPYYPKAQTIEKYVFDNGINAFYNSPELREKCCFIRKVEPLKRALEGKKVWITGLRKQQSAQRESVPMVQWDEKNEIIKFHPILNWTTEQVVEFIEKNAVPYNPLHDQGFVSVGCAPCTRAIKKGEDFRAGRWWWEDKSKKECGLHITK